jgi:transposase
VKQLLYAGIDWAAKTHAKIYTDALARTHRHPQAVRILARAWIRVIWRIWQDHTSYDPAKHGGAVRLLATQG